MTTYGTIPTSPSSIDSPGRVGGFISRTKNSIKSNLAERRPWQQMLDYHAVGVPSSFHDALPRLSTNLTYFRTNYAIIVLLILFLSLLWHPVSLIVFIVMMAAWLFLYFLRDEPLAVFGRTINDGMVLGGLSVFTLVFLFLTNATVNILVALLIGAVVVVLHGVFRRTEDLRDEERGGDTRGLTTTVGSSFS